MNARDIYLERALDELESLRQENEELKRKLQDCYAFEELVRKTIEECKEIYEKERL
jgi:transcription elongation factor GreA-like protein